MKQRTLLYSALFTLCFLFLSCTEKGAEPTEQVRLKNKISEMEVESEKLEGKIKDAGNDPGLKFNLVQELELLKSRTERLRENLKQAGAPH